MTVRWLRGLAGAVALLSAPSGAAWEVEAQWEVEGRVFAHPPSFPEQEHHSASSAIEAEVYRDLGDGYSLTFRPFARIDSADEERTHGDIRELYLLWYGERLEWRLGIDRVFWGSTESVHLVDIVNQQDLIEAPDGEDKLGQPMLAIAYTADWGILSGYLLPYFRERTFPGEGGRLRFPIPVDGDDAEYESGAGQQHVDAALRYSRVLGPAEFGLSYFVGTSRDPWFDPSQLMGPPVDSLKPYYAQIRQAGLDMTWVAGEWLWKLEAVYRHDQPNIRFEREDYWAAAGGFEYTWYGVGGGKTDLGVIAEGIRDGRGEHATTPNEEEIALGLRWSWNDLWGSELLLLGLQDVDDDARTLVAEYGTRLTPALSLDLEAYVFMSQPEFPSSLDFSRLQADHLGSFLADDDFVRLRLTYYY